MHQSHAKPTAPQFPIDQRNDVKEDLPKEDWEAINRWRVWFIKVIQNSAFFFSPLRVAPGNRETARMRPRIIMSLPLSSRRIHDSIAAFCTCTWTNNRLRDLNNR